MKIIKPYGQTRVQPQSQRHFYPHVNNTRVDLKQTLEQDTDALIAVWVSTIDKIFGKPYALKPLDLPKREKFKREEDYNKACQKRKDSYDNKKANYKLRQAVSDIAYKQMCSHLLAQQHEEAEIKWMHKQSLSSELDSKKPLGCKLGKYYEWFVQQKIDQTADIHS